MHGGKFRGRQPESLTRDEWEKIREFLRASSQLSAPDVAASADDDIAKNQLPDRVPPDASLPGYAEREAARNFALHDAP